MMGVGMKRSVTWRLMLTALLGWAVVGMASAQSVARVLMAKGESQLERQGQRQALAAGALLQIGDVVWVGDRALVQLRFTDESLVALRANTVFRIDDYRLAGGAADQERLAVSLVKGGLRTVTGLIGKARPSNVSLTTPTAVVGVRGTQFAALHCADDCIRADGRLERNGTYGGVTDGRIGVVNPGGDVEFGQQEYFYVMDPQTAAQRLMAPPEVLVDRVTPVPDRATVRVSGLLTLDLLLGGQTSVTHLPMPVRLDAISTEGLLPPVGVSGPEWVDLTNVLLNPIRQTLLP